MKTLFLMLLSLGLLLSQDRTFANSAYSNDLVNFENSDHDSFQVSVQKMLNEYKADSYKFMNELPAKNSASGNVQTLFSNQTIENKSFVELKNLYRPISGRAEYQYNDDARFLVDNGDQMLTTLKEMEVNGLTSATLDNRPWSDTYWPLYNGGIAWRYADPKYPDSSDFIKNYNYVWLEPVLAVGNPNPEKYDILSPAEKYDLLIGDSKRKLTAATLQSGKSIYDSEKKVDDWMGLCHGWAPAAYMLPRPTKAITVTAVDGVTKINFYPSDLKALATYTWANSYYRSRFVGGRCNIANPKLDNIGRVVDPECFDSNPATWHLAVVNQIGFSKRSMVLDATYDYEVWNQPIYSYKYSYFNPKTLNTVNNLNDATIKIHELKNDKFKQYRSPKTKYVVGVSMELTYVAETYPTKMTTDVPENDRTVKVTYLYDLELDDNHKIIGGEWYQNAHPDFLWTPDKNTRLLTPFDKELEKQGQKWDTKNPLPQDWSEYAKRTSERFYLPLSKIVEELINQANGNP